MHDDMHYTYRHQYGNTTCDVHPTAAAFLCCICSVIIGSLMYMILPNVDNTSHLMVIVRHAV